MKSSLKATAFFAAAALVASVGTADAQVVDKDNGKCRGTVSKSSTKLNGTTFKAFTGCVKGALKALGGDCSTLAAADTKGKVPGTVQKMKDAVGGAKTKCDGTVHMLSLMEHERCGAPSDGAVPADWSGVADCLEELNDRSLTRLNNAILSPDFAVVGADKDATKCANAISKNAGKLHKTIQKEQGKNQKSLDGGKAPGGTYDWGSAGVDPKNKISGTITKLGEGLHKACDPVSTDLLNAIGSCDDDVDGIIACVVQKVTSSAEGLVASTYDQPGTCASQASVQIRHLDTVLDVGWTGFGHSADTADDFISRVNVDCAGSPDGSVCTVGPTCEDGNCRCSNNTSIICSTPNGADAACGGNNCTNFFGPPLPLSAGGAFTCVVNEVTAVVGTANLIDGSSDTVVNNVSHVYSGIAQNQPCPTCDGGTCNGGANNGSPCTVDATSPTFGALSYSCQPGGAPITGAGLKVDLPFTSGSSSLAATLPCTGPFSFGQDCPCATCSGDSTIGCDSNAVCSAAGAGTCTGAAGEPTETDACTANCVAAGGNDGECDASGPDDMFCDGITRTNGNGFIACSVDADCEAGALGFDGGACTSVVRRPCFLDPIEADGVPGTEGAVLGSTFCTGPTTSSSVNIAAGTPGPGRLLADFEFTPYCSDGATLWGPGGAMCP
jgi:hypothetical protein